MVLWTLSITKYSCKCGFRIKLLFLSSRCYSTSFDLVPGDTNWCCTNYSNGHLKCARWNVDRFKYCRRLHCIRFHNNFCANFYCAQHNYCDPHCRLFSAINHYTIFSLRQLLCLYRYNSKYIDDCWSVKKNFNSFFYFILDTKKALSKKKHRTIYISIDLGSNTQGSSSGADFQFVGSCSSIADPTNPSV